MAAICAWWPSGSTSTASNTRWPWCSDTENATLVTGLMTGLRDRGLDVTKSTLFVLDGAKALKAAVIAVFDHPVPAPQDSQRQELPAR